MNFFKKKNIIVLIIIAIIAVIAIGMGVKLYQGGSSSGQQSSVTMQEGSLSDDEKDVSLQNENDKDDVTIQSEKIDTGSTENGDDGQKGGSDNSNSANSSSGNSNSNSNSNSGSNSGSSSGSNTGSNTGNNSGSNTGSNSGSSSGSNTGSNTGNNSGSNTGSNSGSSSGSNTGSNSGSSSGSNSGSSSGSNSGSSSGSSSDNSQTTPQPEMITCTITIRCDTILSNMDNLNPEKAKYVPSSGYILNKKSVEIEKGSSVFDVTKKACSKVGIPIEYSYMSAYDTYYVKGINNLCEFDCGGESGWMYKVNGTFPNYGCSQYQVKDGDQIVWCYTCNGLGADVGASY